MAMNTRLVWGIGIALVIMLGSAYAYIALSDTPKMPTTLAHVAQGTVTGIYQDISKIAVSIDSVEKIVTINPATKIEKILSQRNADGEVEKQLPIEVDIGDIPNGVPIIIEYESDIDSALEGVTRVAFIIDGNVDVYLTKVALPAEILYLKSQVVSVDTARKNIQYHPYAFNTIGATTMTVAIPDGIAVYIIDDPARIAVSHARVAATLADVKPSQTIFFELDTESLQGEAFTPKAIIISGE